MTTKLHSPVIRGLCQRGVLWAIVSFSQPLRPCRLKPGTMVFPVWKEQIWRASGVRQLPALHFVASSNKLQLCKSTASLRDLPLLGLPKDILGYSAWIFRICKPEQSRQYYRQYFRKEKVLVPSFLTCVTIMMIEQHKPPIKLVVYINFTVGAITVTIQFAVSGKDVTSKAKRRPRRRTQPPIIAPKSAPSIDNEATQEACCSVTVKPDLRQSCDQTCRSGSSSMRNVTTYHEMV